MPLQSFTKYPVSNNFDTITSGSSNHLRSNGCAQAFVSLNQVNLYVVFKACEQGAINMTHLRLSLSGAAPCYTQVGSTVK